MRRSLSELISLQAFKHIVYIPRIIGIVRDWRPFLLNYIGIRNEARTYRLRNGLQIATAEGVDAATIAVVFAKRNYGRIPEGAVVVDIGANIGVFALYAATTAPNCRVYAYEPMPQTFALLEQNVAHNDLQSRILTSPLGVAGECGPRTLHLAGGSPFHSLYSQERSSGNTLSIRTTTLTDIVAENQLDTIDLLKIDCEGAEFEILYATPSHVLARIKEIRLEYHDQPAPHASHQELGAFLEGVGYTITLKRADAGSCGQLWCTRQENTPHS